MTVLYLADTSAYHRSGAPSVRDRWVNLSSRYLIATTGPVRLEVLYSATAADDWDESRIELDDLPQLDCDERAWARAEEVQGILARQPLHHRSVKLNDLLIAAVAEVHGATVLHYDEDYDRIAEVTGQPMEWIVPRGSVD